MINMNESKFILTWHSVFSKALSYASSNLSSLFFFFLNIMSLFKRNLGKKLEVY